MPNRIYAQYADKPKAVAWYGITPTMLEQLEVAAEAVRTSYDIDTALSQSLDVIGRIVVIDRGYESQIVIDGIQWGQPAVQWGGLNIQWQSTGMVINQQVSDAIFRTLIRAKIIKNNSEATLDDVVEGLEFITGTSPIRVIDNEDMTFSVSFFSELDTITRFVLNTFDIVPRPQGVQFLGYTEEPALTQWGGLFGWGSDRARFGPQYFGA